MELMQQIERMLKSKEDLEYQTLGLYNHKIRSNLLGNKNHKVYPLINPRCSPTFSRVSSTRSSGNISNPRVYPLINPRFQPERQG
jgi:hypothetical protein